MTEYVTWFQRATGFAPQQWQHRLASDAQARSRVLRIPTGYGKTLGVLCAWLYHRVHRKDASWPRRLVWALPMRVLSEQTAAVVKDSLSSLGVLWDPNADHDGKVGVHLLMGGASADGEWNLHPEADAVFIGTQDMLLSRALNRGYGAGRARWPVEFGLLNHDALWVLDEVQLMDVGLATSAQLQAFFDEDAVRGFRPRHSWWMSATLQPEWLRSVDTAARLAVWTAEPTQLSDSERNGGLATIRKSLELKEIPVAKHDDFAACCAEAHARLEDGEFGRITLVVCNTVERACATYNELNKRNAAREIELVHSRFRPHERQHWKSRFLERKTCRPGVDRIIVATQVVEAGVDISAGCVVTELAPWSSLVQRFGRCARYGGAGRVIVVDRGRDEKVSAPYESEQLSGALAALVEIAGGAADAGIATIEAYEQTLSEHARGRLYPYHPAHLLIRRELDELFDTTPDLTGADVDISRFIRSGEERDLQVFWLDLPKPRGKQRRDDAVPPRRYRPMRDELCAVPFLRAQDWLCGKATQSDRKPRLRSGVRAWVWDWIDGDWIEATRAMLTPGKLVCVAADVGGYRPERGFDPESDVAVAPVPRPSELAPSSPQDEADESEDGENLSEAREYKTIATHDREVASEAAQVARAVGLPARLAEILRLAGHWHDLGKAHPVFQGTIRGKDTRPSRNDLAKAPQQAWLKPKGTYRSGDDRESRPGFRHELASCLALFGVLRRYEPTHPALLGPWAEVLGVAGLGEMPHPLVDASSATPLERAVLACSAEEFDLLAYLVLCHHGKVRVSMHAGPKDQEYLDRDGRGLPIRGVREGDVLPGVELEEGTRLPDIELTLTPAALGISLATGRSWRDRTLCLARQFGPAALAWLEALLITADRRASKLTTIDPLLVQRGTP